MAGNAKPAGEVGGLAYGHMTKSEQGNYTMNEITWADLDKSNIDHYASKRKPDWLMAAEEAREACWTTHSLAIDNYLAWAKTNNNEQVSNAWRKVQEAERVAIAVDEYAADCRRWYHAQDPEPRKRLAFYLAKYEIIDTDVPYDETSAAEIAAAERKILHPEE